MPKREVDNAAIAFDIGGKEFVFQRILGEFLSGIAIGAGDVSRDLVVRNPDGFFRLGGDLVLAARSPFNRRIEGQSLAGVRCAFFSAIIFSRSPGCISSSWASISAAASRSSSSLFR